MILSLIVAIDENFAIGKDNALLCHLSDDLKNFKKATIGKPIVMGRKTYESIGRLLPGRENIILSRDKEFKIQGAICLSSIDHSIEWGRDRGVDELVFIGGGAIYREVTGLCNRFYITHIQNKFKGADTFFPQIDLSSMKVTESLCWPADQRNEFSWKFQVYNK